MGVSHLAPLRRLTSQGLICNLFVFSGLPCIAFCLLIDLRLYSKKDHSSFFLVIFC